MERFPCGLGVRTGLSSEEAEAAARRGLSGEGSGMPAEIGANPALRSRLNAAPGREAVAAEAGERLRRARGRLEAAG